MFRRKRSVSHGPINPNPSPSAQTAAVQAFRASQTANANVRLSNSAAAAALRKHTPTPTQVEEVQTRRMVQRQQSISSIGPTKAGARHGSDAPLRRASSMSSMSRRTFRDASPGRNSLIDVRQMRNREEIEPVPPVPEVYAASVSPHRRAVSGGPAFQRTNPATKQSQKARIGSTERANISSIAAARSVQGYSSTPPTLGLQKKDSRSSINFSYPINARPNSPRQPSIATLSTDNNSIRTASPAGTPIFHSNSPSYASNRDSRVESAAHKRVVSSPASSGSASHASYVRENDRGRSQNGEASDSDTRVPRTPIRIHTALSNHPTKIPPTVKETEREGDTDNDSTRDEELEYRPIPSKLRNVPTKQTEFSEEEAPARNRGASPTAASDSSPSDIHTPSRSLIPAYQPQERPPSLSPTRSTRFSERLEIAMPGEHLHEPPPRSKSPAKSALKSTSPVQNVTSDRLAILSTKATDIPSESDATSVVSDEGSKSGWKKKHVKVSFEDGAEVIGTAASPPTSPDSIVPSSPQMKWNGSLRSRCDHADEFDEFMKPRPALPSFGSIRGRKRSIEERDPFPLRSGNNRPSLADSAFAQQSTSHDFAIGGLLASNPARKANSDERTAKEETGYESMSLSESSSDEADPNEFILLGRHIPSVRRKDDEPASNGQKQSHKQLDLAVPVISIQPATPMVEEHPKAEGHSRDDPVNDKDMDTTHRNGQATGNDPAYANIVSKRASEDSDSDSLYSDAAESLDDFDGDGFGSIDAVVSGSTPQTSRTTQIKDSEPLSSSRVNGEDVKSQHPTNDQSSISDLPASHGYTNRGPTIQKAAVDNAPASQENQQSLPKKSTAKLNGIPKARQTGKGNQGHSKSSSTHIRMPFDEPNRPNSPTSPKTPNQHERHAAPAARQAKSISPTNRPQSNFKMNTSMRTENAVRPSVRRVASNGSDSSSSFKRERRSNADNGVYHLRRSMRSGIGHTKTESLDERGPSSMSTSQRRPFSSSGEGSSKFRSTMRGGNMAPTKSPSTPFSGLRGVKGKAKGSKAKESGSAFKSRFADSSDDDDVFEFTPVRGIPRRKGEVDGDSTALEDSSDSEAPARVLHSPNLRSKQAAKRNNTSAYSAAITDRTNRMQTMQLRPGSPPSTEKPKKGVLSRLHLSKRPTDDSRIQKSTLESTARRDTPLERTQYELDRLRGNRPYTGTDRPGTFTSISGPAAPPLKNKWSRFSLSSKPGNKLSRHHGKSESISWPLPTPEEAPTDIPPLPPIIDGGKVPQHNGHNTFLTSVEDNTRPHASDGLDHAPPKSVALDTMSDVDPNWASRLIHPRHNRRGTDSILSADNAANSNIASTPLKKKSRFPRLRKVFGLS